MTEPVRERNVIECELFAERTGSTCAVGGHFPDLPFGPAPTFLPEPMPPPNLRRRISARVDWLARRSVSPEQGENR